MNYLISRFNCFLFENNIEIKKDVKYKFNLINKNFLFFGFNNEIPLNINFFNLNRNILKFNYGNDSYFIINSIKVCESCCFKVKHLGQEFFITLSSCLNICTDKENLLNIDVADISFSHTEKLGNILLIHFLGIKNFVVIIENSKVLIASYYDEYNETESEKTFMLKLRDCLNHGRVFKIINNKYEEYLVYLDDYDLKLNSRFLVYTFLDCLLAKNYKYCNNLLNENVKQKDSRNISNFFSEFDYYIELEQNVFALIKKDTLSGIFKFETNNLNIDNIIPYHH